MSSRPKKKIKLSSFTYQNDVYNVGDSVLINPEGSSPDKPYIGKIKDIVQRSKNEGDIEILVAWYYRPEEALGGRKVFHGAMELFSSDHLDWVHRNTVLSHCSVHTLPEYESLESHGPRDFFTRFSYKPSMKTFRPDRVPVYCTCEMPYNPDKKMVMCNDCNDWFHFSCVNLSEDESPQDFTCPVCLTKGQPESVMPDSPAVYDAPNGLAMYNTSIVQHSQ